jgi:hypothetical protein
LLAGLERRLDALEEFKRQGVALVNIWDVTVEPCLRIVVCE